MKETSHRLSNLHPHHVKCENISGMPVKWSFFLSLESGREGEREGDKHLYARDTLIGCLLHAPNRGTWPP